MAQALSRRPLTVENQLQSHTSWCGACGDKGHCNSFTPSTPVFPCKHDSNNASHTFTHHPYYSTFARFPLIRVCLCIYVCVEKERNRERMSLLGTLRQRQCGTNVSSLKINRLLTSRYKTLHLLFMYLCDHSIFLYVHIYYAIQSALLPSAKTEPSKGCQRSLTLVMYSL